MAAVTVIAKGLSLYHKNSIVALSGGQLWCMSIDTAAHDLHFSYSNDDGVTWTEDVSAEITDLDPAAEEHAAIFADVDDVIWVYYPIANRYKIVRGTVSGNDLTLTSKLDLAHSTYAYGSNIIAFPEGDDTRLFYGVSTSAVTSVYRVLYDNGTETMGTPVLVTNWTTAQAYNMAFDFTHTGDGKTPNDSSPDVWVAWCNGNDLEIRKHTWSSGPTWSAGTLRDLDTTTDTGRGVVGWWDGTRFLAGCQDGDNTPLLFERNAADDATNDISPGTITGWDASGANPFDAYYDQTTGDVYWLLESTAHYPSYAKYDRAGDSWDSAVTVIEAETLNVAKGFHFARNEGGNNGSQMLPFWNTSTNLRTESGVISLNSAPGQPTWNNTDNDVKDVAASLLLDWNMIDAESDAQVKYKLERRKNDNLIPTPTDANFETDIGMWVAYSGCAISQSAAQAASGTYSMLIDVTGGVNWFVGPVASGNMDGDVTATEVFQYGIPIQGVGGTRFQAYGVGHTNTAYLKWAWYKADGTFISTTQLGTVCVSGSWYDNWWGIVPPALTVYGIPYFWGNGGVYAAGEDVHIDEVGIGQVGTTFVVPNPDWYTGAAWSTEQWVSTATEQVVLASSWGADGDGTHVYSVWTNDGTADSIAKSAPLRVIPSAKDNPSIGAIANITGKSYLVTWTVTTQTKHHLKIFRDSGFTDLEYDNGVVVTGTKQETLPFLEEGNRWIWLQTYNDEGLASDADNELVTVDWADPPVPLVVPNKTSFQTTTSYTAQTPRIYGGTGTEEGQGQSFKATATSTIDSILVRMSKINVPTDQVIATLYSDSGFTNAIATSDPIDAVDVVSYDDNSSGLFVSFNFPIPASVVSGTTYYLGLERTGTRDLSNYCLTHGPISNLYADGTRYLLASGSWSTQSYDIAIIVNQANETVAGTVRVVVTNPTPAAAEGGTATTGYNEIWRREWDDDTTAIRLDDDLAEDGTFTDYGAASGVKYQYKAIAFNTTNGTSNESDWTA